MIIIWLLYGYGYYMVMVMIIIWLLYGYDYDYYMVIIWLRL